MKHLVVLISDTGTGSNLQAIIDAQESKKLNVKIDAVISDNRQAVGLKRAEKHKIKIEICPKKENLLSLLMKFKPDFVVLAGWKQIVTDEVINKFENRLLNLHPGLVPDSINSYVLAPDKTRALANRGLFGEKAVKNFLDQNSSYAGSSVHFLTHNFDFGPVLTRGFVKIKKGDTIKSLYVRLKKVEHKIYIKALQKLCP